MRLYELAYACRLYKTFTDFDKSIHEFQRATNPALDCSDQSHGKALMKWLNLWGCRQFVKKYHPMALQSLKQWAQIYVDRLPSADRSLIDLPHTKLNVLAGAYGDLKQRRASVRNGKVVTFGATGAAKVLFAIRPHTCPPWDELIRRELHQKWHCDGSAESYCRFLSEVQKELGGLKKEAAHFGIQLDEIPAAVERPNSSLPKLVDEYFWVTYTRRCQPPTRETLKQWLQWSQDPRNRDL